MATVYACQGPGDVGVRAVQVSRCCPWAASAVRRPRGVFRGLVRRARLSGSIHFIKELNNHSRYCFSWHAVQGRMAADWRMVRVSGDLLGKTICGACYAVMQRDGYNFVTCRKNRAAGWSRPRALPRQGATVRKAPDMAHGAPFGLPAGDDSCLVGPGRFPAVRGHRAPRFRRPDGQQLPQVGRSPYLDRAEHGIPACAESSPYTRYGSMMALGEVHAE